MKFYSIFLLGLFFINPALSFQDNQEDNRWSTASLSSHLLDDSKGSDDKAVTILHLKEICRELNAAKQEIRFLRDALSWAINPFFPEISSPSVLAFRSRLQGHLSTLFGRQKLRIEDEEASYLMIFTTATTTVADYIPNSEIQTALRFLVKSIEISNQAYKFVEEYRENKKPLPYIFSSFAEIDRLSYLVSAGISSIYLPQITDLNETEANVLAECAFRSLSSFIKRSLKKNKKGILPEQLILALGTYHLGTIQKFLSKPGNPHRRATLITQKDGKNWYDIDIFMGSGINVGETNYTSGQTFYRYYNPRNLPGLIYVAAPDQSQTYGFRKGTEDYLKAIQGEPREPISPQDQVMDIKIKTGDIKDLVEGDIKDGNGEEGEEKEKS